MAAAAAEKERHEAETTKQRPKKKSKTCTGMGMSPYNSGLAEFRTFTTFPVIRPAVKAMRSKHDRAFAQT